MRDWEKARKLEDRVESKLISLTFQWNSFHKLPIKTRMKNASFNRSEFYPCLNEVKLKLTCSLPGDILFYPSWLIQLAASTIWVIQSERERESLPIYLMKVDYYDATAYTFLFFSAPRQQHLNIRNSLQFHILFSIRLPLVLSSKTIKQQSRIHLRELLRQLSRRWRVKSEEWEIDLYYSRWVV